MRAARLLWCLTNLGYRAQIAGDPQLAESHLRQAAAVSRRLTAPYHLAGALANLSDGCRQRDDVEAACAGYREALTLFAGLARASNHHEYS